MANINISGANILRDTFSDLRRRYNLKKKLEIIFFASFCSYLSYTILCTEYMHIYSQGRYTNALPLFLLALEKATEFNFIHLLRRNNYVSE